MEMDEMRCKTTEGVLKELAMFVLIYNLVRQVIVRAATGSRRAHQLHRGPALDSRCSR